MAEKKQWYKEDDFSRSTYWQNFYFYRISINENFKMEVEQRIL